MDILTQGLSAVLMLLPPSPFSILDDMAAGGVISEWLGWVNWFVPVSSWLVILETWLAGIGVYYLYQVVLRWLRAIE